jgi:hypothetical protein
MCIVQETNDFFTCQKIKRRKTQATIIEKVGIQKIAGITTLHEYHWLTSRNISTLCQSYIINIRYIYI